MWTRAQLKDRCKLVMKQNYWIMFLVCLVGNILSGSVNNLVNINFNFGSFPEHHMTTLFGYYPYYYDIFGLMILMFFFVLIVGTLLYIAYQTFIGGPIRCGMARFFFKNTESNQSFSEMFSIFSTHYLNVCKIMFLMHIKLVGWTLLFIIPGIVKSYEYSMIPYLLAENPDMSSSDAFRLSREMTMDEKMNLWILDLSFIGWQILGNILIIGNLFVNPYREGTRAEAYLVLKEKARYSSYY